eukprot:3318312-Pleurochrysis_carterae.AAC.1
MHACKTCAEQSASRAKANACSSSRVSAARVRAALSASVRPSARASDVHVRARSAFLHLRLRGRAHACWPRAGWARRQTHLPLRPVTPPHALKIVEFCRHSNEHVVARREALACCAAVDSRAVATCNAKTETREGREA